MFGLIISLKILKHIKTFLRISVLNLAMDFSLFLWSDMWESLQDLQAPASTHMHQASTISMVLQPPITWKPKESTWGKRWPHATACHSTRCYSPLATRQSWVSSHVSKVFEVLLSYLSCSCWKPRKVSYEEMIRNVPRYSMKNGSHHSHTEQPEIGSAT